MRRGRRRFARKSCATSWRRTSWSFIAEDPKASGRMPTNQLLARNIKRLRIQQSMSQDHLATNSGVDKTWVDGMERGQQDATVAQLEQLARALRVETAELFKQENAQATQAAKSIQPTQPTPATRKHASQANRRARNKSGSLTQ